MSTVEEKIALYEAEIAEIKAGRGIYADATTKEKRDTILSYLTIIQDLYTQQGMFLITLILCVFTTILTCRCVLFAFY